MSEREYKPRASLSVLHGKEAEMRREVARVPFVTDGEDQTRHSFVHAQDEDLMRRIVQKMRTIFDPELPVNIYELGLIYSIDIDAARTVRVTMTLTAPACPVAGTLPGQIRQAVADVEDVTGAEVVLVWEPAWTKDRMSEAARLELGLV